MLLKVNRLNSLQVFNKQNYRFLNLDSNNNFLFKIQSTVRYLIDKKIFPYIFCQKFNNENTYIVHKKNLLLSLLIFKNHINFQYKILTSVSGVDFLSTQFVKNFRFAVVYDLSSHMGRGIVFFIFTILLYPHSLLCETAYIENGVFGVSLPSFVLLDWDFLAWLFVHYKWVLIGLLGLYDFFSNKDEPVFQEVDFDFEDDAGADSENSIPESDPEVPTTTEPEPVVEEGTSEEVRDTDGDLVLIPEGKTLPQAILDGLKGAIEWLIDKARKFLDMEPKESLTALVIIRALVKLVVKGILTAGSVWLSYYIFLSPFFIYLVRFHEGVCRACKLDVMSILSQLWGWQGAYLFFGAAHTIPILVGICVYYHLSKFLQS